MAAQTAASGREEARDARAKAAKADLRRAMTRVALPRTASADLHEEAKMVVPVRWVVLAVAAGQAVHRRWTPSSQAF